MKKYEFYNGEEIISGVGALKQLPNKFAQIGARKAILVTGPTLTKIGVVQQVMDIFEGSKVEIKVLYNTVPNDSSLDVVNEIAQIYKANNCDSIIALGGGSNIDTAKGVKILISNQSTDIRQYMGFESAPLGLNIPFAVIPTTAGTGSEATKAAVISDVAKKVKLEFITNTTIPHISILDPLMTLSLPKKATYTTGMDALTHAIEGFTGTQSQPLTDQFAVSAFKLIGKYIDDSVADGSNQEARIGMLEGSLCAGVCFSNSMVGAVHAIGHSVGGYSGVSHDRAMTMLLPACIEFNADVCDDKYGEVLYYFAGEEAYKNAKKGEYGKSLAEYIDKKNKYYHEEIGIPVRLSEAGVKEEDLETIAFMSLRDGAILSNPKTATFDDVMGILKKVF